MEISRGAGEPDVSDAGGGGFAIAELAAPEGQAPGAVLRSGSLNFRGGKEAPIVLQGCFRATAPRTRST
jgi:hypothetical protein